MADRELAVIKKIDAIFPIKGADRIELVQIGGWCCITKKGEFVVGDSCVYFEIDSFLPNEEEFAFLGTAVLHQGMLGHRIKSMKLRGAISQGLALPLSQFPKDKVKTDITKLSVGSDLTDLLKVTKYDNTRLSPTGNVVTTSKSKGSFPSFIPKTDQPRIQNLAHYFTLHKDTLFEETYKLDGSSCTMYKVEKEATGLWNSIKRLFTTVPKIVHFGVCSRNLELQRNDTSSKTYDNGGTISEHTPSNFWLVAKKYNIEKDLPAGFAVQGELIAPNIQGNYEKVKEPEYHIFNVYDINGKTQLPPLDAEAFVKKYLPSANYIKIANKAVKIFEGDVTYESLQQRVNTTSINAGVISEGRVYKSHDGKVTFKVINNEYLLKTGK